MPDAMCPRNVMFHIIKELTVCAALTGILTEVTMYLILHYNVHTIDKGSAKLKFKFIFLMENEFVKFCSTKQYQN